MDTKSLATGEAALIFPVTARALMNLHPLVFGFQKLHWGRPHRRNWRCQNGVYSRFRLTFSHTSSHISVDIFFV